MRSLGFLLVCVVCSSCEDDGPDPAADAGHEADAAVEVGEDAGPGDPAQRYQPAEPLDPDNVVNFGDPIEVLDLPPPPTSGFRIIVPPRDLDSGDEVTTCVAWPMPEVTNRIVYAARLYTTPGLHHSNVIAKPEDPDEGPQPYPRCRQGAADPFERLSDGVIPDVLFANSTQVEGAESISFPPGYGFRIDPADEIITSLHLLNPTATRERAEVVYDFFTMAESELTDEVAPFAMDVTHFNVEVGATADIGGACDVYGGSITTLMPHTHQYAVEFVVETLAGGSVVGELYRGGGYDLDSDIQLFDPPLSLEGVDQMRITCTFRNTTDHGIVRGIGENEMCILFGYLTPVTSQFLGNIASSGGSCLSLPLGQGL